MFLISKIVRGRRLLHELEAQEAKEIAMVETAAASGSAAGMRSRAQREHHRRSTPGEQPEKNEDVFGKLPATVGTRPKKSAARACQRACSERRPGTGLLGDVFGDKRQLQLQLRLNETGASQGGGLDRRRRSRSTRVTSTAETERNRRAARQRTLGSSAGISVPSAASVESSFERNSDDVTDASLGGDGTARLRRTSSMPSVSEVANASSLRHYDYDGKLNKMQRRALRFTWHRLQTRNGGKRVESVFEEVFDRIVRALPLIREMFTTRAFLCAMSRTDVATLRDHARVTVKVLDLMIKNLDCDSTRRTDTGSILDPRLLGRAHGPLRPYGLTGNFFEKLGETIIDVVLAQEAVRDLPGAANAWVVLTACLVDQMRAGFEENRCQSYESRHKTSRVLHYASLRLGSVDTAEQSTAEDISGACPFVELQGSSRDPASSLHSPRSSRDGASSCEASSRSNQLEVEVYPNSASEPDENERVQSENNLSSPHSASRELHCG